MMAPLFSLTSGELALPQMCAAWCSVLGFCILWVVMEDVFGLEVKVSSACNISSFDTSALAMHLVIRIGQGHVMTSRQ